MLRCDRIAACMLACLTLVQPTLALADDPAPPSIAIIRRAGAPTPFEGVLYSTEAYAKMKAEQEEQQSKFDDKLRLELGLQAADLNLRTATTANALRACRDEKQAIYAIKDKQIEQLDKHLADADGRSHVSTLERVGWFALGVATVLGGALAVHWASTR